jgi:hypothetical protein
MRKNRCPKEQVNPIKVRDVTSLEDGVANIISFMPKKSKIIRIIYSPSLYRDHDTNLIRTISTRGIVKI